MKIRVSGLRVNKISDVTNSGLVHGVSLNFISGTPDCLQTIPTGVGCMPDTAPHIHPNDGEDTLCALSRPKIIGVFDSEMAQSIIARIHLFHLDGIQFQGEISTILLDNLRRTLVPDICPEIMIVKYLSGDCLQMEKQCDKYKECADAFLLDCSSDIAILHTHHFLEELGSEGLSTPFFIRVTPDAERVEACLDQVAHPLFEGIDIDFSLLKDDVNVLSVLREINGSL